MALIADTGAVYGLYDRRDRHHAALRQAIERERGAILIPSAILVEIDYMLRMKLGIEAELDLLGDIQAGAFTLESFTASDLVRSRRLIQQYRDLDLGLADAAVIAAAERLHIRRVLTIDERHFRAVRPSDGTSFTLLPADA